MASTRKLPVAISFGTFKTRSAEFLLPAIFPEQTDDFFGIETGHQFPYGAISYIGKEIKVSDIIERLVKSGIALQDMEEAGLVLERYLQRLQNFRIGNVLAVKYTEDRDFELVKVAERPPLRKKPLP